MRKRPFIAALVAYCILALFAMILGVPNGPSLVYADGNGPIPPTDPSPPADSTLTAVNADVSDQEDSAVNVDPKQDVSLRRIAQLIVLGVI